MGCAGWSFLLFKFTQNSEPAGGRPGGDEREAGAERETRNYNICTAIVFTSMLLKHNYNKEVITNHNRNSN